MEAPNRWEYTKNQNSALDVLVRTMYLNSTNMLLMLIKVLKQQVSSVRGRLLIEMKMPQGCKKHLKMENVALRTVTVYLKNRDR